MKRILVFSLLVGVVTLIGYQVLREDDRDGLSAIGNDGDAKYSESNDVSLAPNDQNLSRNREGALLDGGEIHQVHAGRDKSSAPPPRFPHVAVPRDRSEDILSGDEVLQVKSVIDETDKEIKRYISEFNDNLSDLSKRDEIQKKYVAITPEYHDSVLKLVKHELQQ